MWLIVQMRSMLITKLSLGEQLDRIQSLIKTKHDNDVIDHVGLVYAKIEIKLSKPIWTSVVYDENQIRP